MKSNKKYFLILLIMMLVFVFQNINAASDKYFKIKVIDEATGRGIPLVEVRTQSWIRYYTDSNGLVAFYEPGLMDQDLYLFIESEGYDYPGDIMGNKGFVINAAKADSIVVKMQRINVAERLYRITGAGIYRDSHLLGMPAPIKNSLLNGKVLGQDSNISTIYDNKIFWLWGDTFKPAYPWGNFSKSAATSLLPSDGGLPPETGVDLNYFVDSTGFSKSMILLKEKGFVWFDWLIPVRDENGQEQLIAKYARVKTDFTNHERGIAVYNKNTEMFEKYKQIDEWLDEYHTTNHHFMARVQNKSYAFLTSEFKFSRVEPDLDQLSEPGIYENYTCLKAGTTYNPQKPDLDRDQTGKLIWDWKQNTDVVDLIRQKELLKAGLISEEERWICFEDMATGEPLDLLRGSIYWNNYRQRWILIIQKNVGEVWYAEADTPTGPWVFARKILTHNQFFYNPVHHPFFDQQNGRIIYFEGTYTNSFSGYPLIIPRYEYNQIMYRLDLDDPRLFLPLPVYHISTSEKRDFYSLKETLDPADKDYENLTVSFFAYAPGRNLNNLIPVYQNFSTDGPTLFEEAEGNVLFYALPPDELPFEKYCGFWECNMRDGVFLNRNFKLNMSTDLNQLSASISNAGYSVTQLNSSGNSFELAVNYVDKVYQFQGSIQNGKISGTWTTPDSSAVGTWTGVMTDYQWQPVHSPRVVPLYLYSDPQTSEYMYSTKAELPNTSLIRSEKPVCRIWETPSQNMGIDFSIIPQ